MLRTVRLYGELGEKFGREFQFDVKNSLEAIKALKANFKDFEKYLIENSTPGYHIITDNGSEGIEDISNPSKGEIKIIPVVAGAGGKFFRIVLGVALVAAAFFVPGLPAIAATALRSVGTSLIFGGISELLSPTPTASSPVDRPENKPSTFFNGAVNTAAQGNPVPILYGELIVGSLVVSSGLESTEAPI